MPVDPAESPTASQNCAPARLSAADQFVPRGPWPYWLTSGLVLIPCFWQSRIQAGDLGSHIYNAWLAQLIARGQAPGLAVVRQSTNILFDLWLAVLLPVFGAAAAQRIAVSAAVLVFFWGAFAFNASVTGRPPWLVAPVLAMLSYGWVFHMGFFNFYVSLGLCFWALAVTWDGRRRGWLALPLLALACLAHALPVVWAVTVWVYGRLWRQLSRRARGYLLGMGLAALLLIRAALMVSLRTRWYTFQVWLTTGADQLYVFGARYKLLELGLLAVWIWALAVRRGSRTAARGTPDKLSAGALPALAVLMAAANVLIPDAIWLPHYQHQLAYFPERMSLPLGVLVCAWLAPGRARWWPWCALPVLALAFFGFLYVDESALNGLEDQVDHLVASLPPGQRVVMTVDTAGSQVNAVTHMIDRACIGACASYANYEPSSAAFRIRIAGQTAFAAPSDAAAGSLGMGTYVVHQQDLPLAQIVAGRSGQLQLRNAVVGKPLGMTAWTALR